MFAGAKQLFSGEIYLESSVQEDMLGALGMDQYGDLYRYAQVGASNITAGKLQVCPAPKANHHNVAATTAVTADGRTRSVTLTLGATAAVANEYAGGFLVANDVSPEGETYRITGHPAAASSATLAVEVDRPFVSNIATTSEFTLVHQVQNGVVEAAVEERVPAGVPLVDMTAAYHGWLKIVGVAAVLQGDATNLGEELVQHASTAGAVDAASTTYGTAFAYYTVGKAKVAGVDTEFNPVDLMIWY